MPVKSSKVFPTSMEGEKKDETAVPSVVERHEASDGGLRAWLVVFGVFLAGFGSLGGPQQAYGVWLVRYREQEFRDASDSILGLVVAVSVVTTDILCPVVAAFEPVINDTYLFAFGTACSTMAFVGLSFATRVWEVMLLQGVLAGIGSTCFLVPGLAILSSYFVQKRGLVMAIAVSGCNVGALLFPVIFTAAEKEVSLANTNRIIALVVFFALSVATLLTRPKPRQRDVGVSWRSILPDFSCLKQPPIAFICLAKGLGWSAIWGITAWLSSLGEEVASPSVGPYVLSIYNGAAIAGRFLGGRLSDRFGVLSNFVFCSITVTVIILSTWLPSDSTAAVTTCAVLLGLSCGAWQTTGDAVSPSVAEALDVDVRSAISVSIFFSIAAFAAAPLGGTLLNESARRPYLPMGALYAGIFAVAALFAALARGSFARSARIKAK